MKNSNHDNGKIIIGRVLKNARMDYQYTIVELATMLEKDPSYISRVENGLRNPSAKLLKNYAIILELDYKELLACAGLLNKAANTLFDLSIILESEFVYFEKKLVTKKQKNEILKLLNKNK